MQVCGAIHPGEAGVRVQRRQAPVRRRDRQQLLGSTSSSQVQG